MTMQILQELNAKQQQAAAHTDGAMLVVAGPGTGKTNVITHRIAHLIRNHQVVASSRFLPLPSRTKLHRRCLSGIKAQSCSAQHKGLEVRIHTFHAFCVRLLRQYAEEIGLETNFAIFRSGDTGTRCSLNASVNSVRVNRLTYPPWKMRARYHRCVQGEVGRSNRQSR